MLDHNFKKSAIRLENLKKVNANFVWGTISSTSRLILEEQPWKVCQAM
jgi:hypothetical protein